MSEKLLLKLATAAASLDVSVRTVQRLASAGKLVKVGATGQGLGRGRPARITAESLNAYVQSLTGTTTPTPQKGKECRTVVRIVKSGGSASPTHAGRELDALLAPQTGGRQKR